MGVLNTTPRTWVSGEVVTVAEMNTEVRDAITAMEAAWGTWTPTLSGFTLGTGSNTVARYNRVGKTIDFFLQVTLGTGGAVTGSITFTLPVTTAYTTWKTGDVTAFDSSAVTTQDLIGLCTSTTVMTVRAYNTSATAYIATGATIPFTWAAGDILTVRGSYEAA